MLSTAGTDFADSLSSLAPGNAAVRPTIGEPACGHNRALPPRLASGVMPYDRYATIGSRAISSQPALSCIISVGLHFTA